MRHLGMSRLGGKMIAVATSLCLTLPAGAHTADQYLGTMHEISGLDLVNQSRSGHDLNQRLDLPSEMPLWRYLYHGTPDFAVNDAVLPVWAPMAPIDAVVAH
ncbi:MAG: hypothetical protein ACRBBQ_02300 [Cognatishimia sp.]